MKKNRMFYNRWLQVSELHFIRIRLRERMSCSVRQNVQIFMQNGTEKTVLKFMEHIQKMNLRISRYKSIMNRLHQRFTHWLQQSMQRILIPLNIPAMYRIMRFFSQKK